VKRLIVLLAGLVLAVAPAAALAQTVTDVVVELDDGVYIDAGLPASESDIRASVNRARNAGIGLYVVLLADDPASGAVSFAESILNQVRTGTVLVLSGSSEGMVSTEIDQAAIETALDRGFEAGGGDSGYVSAVVDSLIGTSSGGSDDGGGSGFIIFIAIVGGLVLLVWWALRRSKQQSDERRGDLIGEARGEIKQQLDSMANTILEITDIVSASDSRDDNDYLEQAGATYSSALESYEDATSLRDLENLSDRLDEARWQLDAATAIAENRPVPEKPKKQERPVCFFDPTHRDATEMVDIDTSSGKRTVRVCTDDAERLRRGKTPDPRMINVGGRRVPAAMAPRSHGGGGMDWLDIFSMMAGGAGQVASYDWGRSRPSRTTRRSGSGSSRSVSRSSGSRSRAGRTRRRRR
jgi:hypothetical protein